MHPSDRGYSPQPDAAVLLVSGGHPYSPAIRSHYVPEAPSHPGETGLSRPVSGGLDLTTGFAGGLRSVADPDPRSCLPGRKHSFERCLIPAPYSCRTHSPAGSEARDANPDFTSPPFPSGRLSPAGVLDGIRHPVTSDRTGYFVDPLRLTENRHAVAGPFDRCQRATTGRAC
jgi:hypothetical protein